MLIPFGVLSAAAFAPFGDYELIATEILTANQASITFSNLGDYSSTYKHLEIRAVGRTNRSAVADFLNIRFNSDTGANYVNHNLFGTTSSVSSSNFLSETGLFAVRTTGATAPSSNFAGGTSQILDAFSSTKNKTVRSLSGHLIDASDGQVQFLSGLWQNTNSITSITAYPNIGTNLVLGTRISLYGIRG
jgi:hypothetical protein